MRPIFQKNINNPDKNIVGDCLRACVCSLLEISDENVPNFAEDKNYPMQLNNFLKEKGYRMRHSEFEPKNIDCYMAWGISPRGLNHSVIYHSGELVHDPYPTGGNVIPNTYVWLEKR